MLKTDLPKKYWDSLQTKEELYAKFDGLPDNEKLLYDIDPDGEAYFKDDEFTEVGEKLKTVAKTLQPILQDITAHFTTVPELCQNEAATIVNGLDLTNDENIAVMADVINRAFDTSDVRSFINLVETGNGVPAARAACRAYKRYKEFRQQDDKLMEEFKRTAEFKMQSAELKLGIRDTIEVIK